MYRLFAEWKYNPEREGQDDRMALCNENENLFSSSSSFSSRMYTFEEEEEVESESKKLVLNSQLLFF